MGKGRLMNSLGPCQHKVLGRLSQLHAQSVLAVVHSIKTSSEGHSMSSPGLGTYLVRYTRFYKHAQGHGVQMKDYSNGREECEHQIEVPNPCVWVCTYHTIGYAIHTGQVGKIS